MPEGLAQAMTDVEFVDLIGFLSKLKEPVSIVGQYRALGPVSEAAGPALDPASKVDPSAPARGPSGALLPWRRLDADAESLVDLTPLASDPAQAIYLSVPITSPSDQMARLILDTPADVRAWLDGKAVSFNTSGDDPVRTAAVALPRGRVDLLIRVPGGGKASLVTTVVSARPVEFAQGEAAKVSSR